MISLGDFYILHAPLQQEVERRLPLPVTVSFSLAAPDGSLQPLPSSRAAFPWSSDFESPWDDAPRMVDGKRILPLLLPAGEQLVIVIEGPDPALLRKISADWLREMREELYEALARMRLGFVDPETALYNRRAAETYLHHPAACGYFFMVHAVFPRRTAAGNLQKVGEVADLLLALTGAYCFSFGYGVFGLLLPEQSRDQALKTAHSLQHQLKREGMSKVQIGFGCMQPHPPPPDEPVLDRYWRSLSMAENRGPFGLCDIDAVDERLPHPFQLTQAEVLEQLKKNWQRLAAFTLVLLVRQPMPGPTADFSAVMRACVPSDAVCLWAEGNRILLLFPDIDAVRLQRDIDEIKVRCLAAWGEGAVAMGIASWPCLDFAKRDIPGNCLKALLHGSFLGPGAVVALDHLSLNISGDLFFEEGEYRAAIREYRRGLQLQPGDVNLLNSLGVALVECDQARQAVVCFQEVLRKEPRNYMALVNLGHVLQALGRKESALECYQAAYQARPGEDGRAPDLFLPLARLYFELSEYEQALAVLEQWHACPGSDKEFLLFRLLGQAYLECGRPEEAIRACERALRLFPRDSVSLSILGLLYVEQGEGDEVGLVLCRKALDLDKFNPDHWHRLGRALLHAGDPTAAGSATRHGLQLQQKPKRSEGLILLARVHAAQGRNSQAVRRLLQALRLKGCSPRQASRARALLAELAAR